MLLQCIEPKNHSDDCTCCSTDEEALLGLPFSHGSSCICQACMPGGGTPACSTPAGVDTELHQHHQHQKRQQRQQHVPGSTSSHARASTASGSSSAGGTASSSISSSSAYLEGSCLSDAHTLPGILQRLTRLLHPHSIIRSVASTTTTTTSGSSSNSSSRRGCRLGSSGSSDSVLPEEPLLPGQAAQYLLRLCAGGDTAGPPMVHSGSPPTRAGSAVETTVNYTICFSESARAVVRQLQEVGVR